MIDEKIARVKKLIAQRETIDAELASLFNMTKRGRPARKDNGTVEADEQTQTADGEE